jgi:hypothetical protein
MPSHFMPIHQISLLKPYVSYVLSTELTSLVVIDEHTDLRPPSAIVDYLHFPKSLNTIRN